MPASFAFGRADNSPISPSIDTVTPNLAVQLTATLLTGFINACPTVTTSAQAVRLPLNFPVGSPILVHNTGAAALLVFPPLTVAGAAAGGKIYGTAAAPAADASFSVAAGKSAIFYAHPNGIDFIGVIGA